jgi:universal stress protein A
MLGYNRILCALDFDEHAVATLRLASALAKESDAVLCVLHVARIPHRDMDVPLPFDADPSWEKEARSRLAKLADQNLPAEVTHELHVVSGLPDLDIVRMAVQLKADLIVMATHGRGGISHLILGSVAEHVIREAGCPVLILRSPKQA